jgi:hypothetical protein
MSKKSYEISSINFVHDPEAAEKWFDIYTNLLLEELKNSKKISLGEYNMLSKGDEVI